MDAITNHTAAFFAAFSLQGVVTNIAFILTEIISFIALILKEAVSAVVFILQKVVISIAIVLQTILTAIVTYVKRLLPVLISSIETHTKKSYEKLPDSWEKVTDGSYSVRKRHQWPIFPMFYTLLTVGFYLIQSQLMIRLY